MPAGFERDSYCTGFEQCEKCTGPSSTWTIEKVCPADFAAWLDFNQFLAAAAHARSLGIFLKNNYYQAPQLVSTHDAVLSEQCLQYSECDGYVPFVLAGKAVLLTEYSNTPPDGAEDREGAVMLEDANTTTNMCSKAAALGFSAIKKNTALTATPRTGCCGATPCPASTTCGTGCSFSTASPNTLAPTPPTAPTAAPTAMPTPAPTRKPTKAPTAAPTRKPTKKPTAPTAAPTRKPTKKPTAPTAAPTRKPTKQPTVPTTTVG